MATEERPSGSPRPAPAGATRTDRSPWNWLLVIPIVLPLLVPLYDRRDPELFGWPFFYWIQLVFIGLGVITTATVYRMTKRRRGGNR